MQSIDGQEETDVKKEKELDGEIELEHRAFVCLSAVPPMDNSSSTNEAADADALQILNMIASINYSYLGV